MKAKILLVFILVLTFTKSFSQLLPVNGYVEDILRREQIKGNGTDPYSFTIRPIDGQSAIDTSDYDLRSFLASKVYCKFDLFGISSGIQLLPVNWLSDYNTKRPYQYNDGPLYPNKGYQSMLSTGFMLKAGLLRVQFKPEFVYAQNQVFNTFADVQGNNNSSTLMNAYFNHINGIDAPERFGNSQLTHMYPGQSAITINYKNVEAGVSTENLWWGPGIRNSIMMSNAAPGFFHWTFNSTKPLKTIIGSFEWQLIGGNLKQSGFPPDDINKLTYGKDQFIPKPKVTRYLSAYTVNWQPKWLKGLYLGVTGYDYLDKDSIYNNKNVLKKLIPVIMGSSLKANSGSGDGQDFAIAFNMRQVLPAYNAEFYIEWARNDRSADITDFLLEPDHSAAYTIGGRKLFDLSKDNYLQIKTELTQLQRPATFLLRDEPTWYEHLLSPRDGYTNEGRYVGAGVGPGSNSFLFDISYIRGRDDFGVALERLVHDNDLYYTAFAGTNTYDQHWVDLSGTLYSNIKLNRYQISAEITPVYTLNYEYQKGESLNLHARLSFTYCFK
jgi:hypothetical protein